MTDIVIHRKLGRDASRVFWDVIDTFTKDYEPYMKIRVKGVIDIIGTRITVRSGTCYEISGILCDYYCTDDEKVASYLACTGAKRFQTMDELLKIILEGSVEKLYSKGEREC